MSVRPVRILSRCLGVRPGWVFLVVGLLAFFALVRHLGTDRVVDPRG